MNISLPLLVITTLAVLALGYTLYGRFVARHLGMDANRPTPANRLQDGRDFVPTKPFYLLGQHFSAIAAAGPIVGPILACSAFGWLPCLLWIVLGVIFIGAVHDFSALFASVRHDARSVAEIVRAHIGPRAAIAVLMFIWVALIYVIIAFTDTTAATFVGQTEELQGSFSFNPGGAVAASSILYLSLSILMGVVQRRWNPPLLALTLIFVPATLGVVWAGTKISTLFLLSAKSWAILILFYCFIASLLPVWALQQPRGYLGGFVLYLAIAVGTIGALFGNYTIQQPAFTTAPLASFSQQGLFPFLFVTIACGACSGFHGLVCSGTTSKQISRESHCRPIGYGAMLLEGFVALIALTTILIIPQTKDTPGRVYGNGLGQYMTLFLGPENFRFAATFGAMAFSTFVFDTLDVSVRLARYILQELSGVKGKLAVLAGTALTVSIPLLLVLNSEPGAYRKYWILFGTSNQLLAALTLLGITVWLKRSGRKIWFTFWPMLFVGTITVWSLLIQAKSGLTAFRDATGSIVPSTLANGVVAVILIALAMWVASEAGYVLARSSERVPVRD
jgi:carbon starvation protein